MINSWCWYSKGKLIIYPQLSFLCLLHPLQMSSPTFSSYFYFFVVGFIHKLGISPFFSSSSSFILHSRCVRNSWIKLDLNRIKLILYQQLAAYPFNVNSSTLMWFHPSSKKSSSSSFHHHHLMDFITMNLLKCFNLALFSFTYSKSYIANFLTLALSLSSFTLWFFLSCLLNSFH